MHKLTARLLAVAALVLLGAALWWRLTAYYDARGYARAQAEARVVAEEQARRIRDLQRAAELRYVVQAEARDRFIVKTVTEIRYVTSHLAACPVGEPAVRLFNAAAACARGDSAAACGPDQPVPGAQ